MRLNHLAYCCALFVFHPSALFGATTAYLRTPGTSFCNVVAATNASPIRITVDNAAQCGLTSGAAIIVNEVEGNTAANINAMSRQQVRYIGSLSGNTFSLLDGGKQNVAGNGNYTHSGRVGLVTPYTLKAPPVVWLDGAGGALTNAMSNTGATGRANSENPIFKSLGKVVNKHLVNYDRRWGADMVSEVPLSNTLNCALYWMATGSSSCLQAAIWGLQNPDQLVGSPACDETTGQCGIVGHDNTNYAAWNGATGVQAYSIVKGHMAAADKTNFLNFMLNDLPYSEGGIDTVAHSKLPLTAGEGTLSFVNGSAVVTGSGTNFTSIPAGAVIIAPRNTNWPSYVKVISVQSATRLTISMPANGNFSTDEWEYAPGWNSSYYGALWYQKHNTYAPLCGGSRCSHNYPTSGGTYDDANGGTEIGLGIQNLAITFTTFWIQLGIATCDDDVRGCVLLEQAYEFWYDSIYPFSLATWTGFNQSGYNYSQDRTEWMYGVVVNAIRNSFTNGPDLTGGHAFSHNPAFFYMGDLPNTGIGSYVLPYGELSGPQGWDVLHMQSFAIDQYLNANSPEAGYANYWFRNYSGYIDSTGITTDSGGGWLPMMYVFVDPSVAQCASIPTAYGFNQTDYAKCHSIFGSKCPTAGPETGFFFGISKTGFSPADTKLAIDALSNAYYMDHSGADIGNTFGIHKNVPLMAGDDNNALSSPHTGVIELGGKDRRIENGDWAVVHMPRWTDGANEGGQNKFAYAMVDSTGAYTSGANATRVQRQTAHLKASGAQDYIVEYVDVALSGPVSGANGAGVRAYYDMALDGCGSSSDSKCISASLSERTITNKQPNAKLVANVVPVAGNASIAVGNANESNTDGSYKGGGGFTWRYWVCSSTDGKTCDPLAIGGEWVGVYLASTSSSAMMPPLTQLSASKFRVLQIGDAKSPKVVAFATGGVTYAASGFKSTHAGVAQYLIAGLTPGSYTVTLNNAPIKGSPFRVVSSDNTLYFEGASGAYTINSTGGTGIASSVEAPATEPAGSPEQAPSAASASCPVNRELK